MHKWLFAMLLSAVLLVACGQNPAGPTGNSGADSADADALCGDKSRLAAEINLFNWSDYINEDVMIRFRELCGVKVNLDLFPNNEDMIAKIQAGNSGYDIVVPSDYAVDLMIRRGLLAELDKANIPNLANIDPDMLGLYYDPTNTYSIPYQWGTTAIAYNARYFETPPDSWAYLFDPALVCQHRGFVSMLDDEREAIGAALVYLGYSLNDTDPAHHAEAAALLIAQKPCLAGYNSDNYTQQLIGEEVVLAQVYSGGGALARSENPDIFYAYPKEGGSIWQDNLAIPKDAPRKYTAEVFINFLLDAAIGAENTNYIYFFTPNQASEPLLNAEYRELLETGGFVLSDAVRARLEWIERTDASVIFSDTWTRVRSR